MLVGAGLPEALRGAKWQSGMRGRDARLEGVGMDVNHRVLGRHTQPCMAKLLGNRVRPGQAVLGRHAYMGHDVDSATEVADSQVADVGEAFHPLGRMPKLMPEFGITVVEESQEHLTTRFDCGPGNHQADPKANNGVEPGGAEHQADRGRDHSEGRETVCPGVLAIGHEGCARDLAADAQLVLSHRFVADEPHHSCGKHETRTTEISRVAKGTNRLEDDESGTRSDQQNHDQPGQVFEAMEPVAKPVRRRFPGKRESDPDYRRPGDVHTVVQGVAKQCNRAAEQEEDHLRSSGKAQASNTEPKRPDAFCCG